MPEMKGFDKAGFRIVFFEGEGTRLNSLSELERGAGKRR
jgi:hypothetical protein